jgi:transcriptional regulator
MSTRSDQERASLLQGTLDLLILRTLQWGPQHGYGIAAAIHANSNALFQVETGSLYPALHRLERQKWIAAEWKTSENQQRVRVYRLTPQGKRQLLRQKSRWQQLTAAVASILHAGSKESVT